MTRVFLVAMSVLLGGCSVTPDPGERTGPTVTMSEVRRGAVPVMASTDDEVPIQAPDPCPDGTLLIGSFWQVESFPIEILVSGSDSSGIEWLRVATDNGILSAQDPATVTISTVPASGVDYQVARADYPADDPRSPRLFRVTVSPRDGAAVVDLEAGAADFSGNTSYTWLTHTGDNDALCERF